MDGYTVLYGAIAFFGIFIYVIWFSTSIRIENKKEEANTIKINPYDQLPVHRKWIDKKNFKLLSINSCSFVCNHQSTFEIPILIWFLRKYEARFVGKKELGNNIPSVSYYLKNGGSVLIDRKQPEDALQKIDSFCDRVKKNNWSIVIFPEGTRSKDGTPKKFRKKGLKLILNKIPNADIIPISINNSYKFNHYSIIPHRFCQCLYW